MTHGGPIAITLVNDYEIIVHGLARMLEPYGDSFEIVETEAGGVAQRTTDIALFDTFGGRRHSLERVGKMAADHDIGRVVLYTWDLPAPFLSDVDDAAIDGVIMKSETGDRLVDSLIRVHRGERLRPQRSSPNQRFSDLTEREREVLALIAQGASNPAIAAELYLSAETIKTHVRRLFRKLHVQNRTQAALLAAAHGLGAPQRSTPVT